VTARMSLKQTRAVAMTLCLFATVYVLVLLVAQGMATKLPPVIMLGLILLTSTPFLAYLALDLIMRRVGQGGFPPRGLMFALSAMMAVPSLCWALSFVSQAGQAIAATSPGAFAVAIVVSAVPAALAIWLAIAFFRLSVTQGGVA